MKLFLSLAFILFCCPAKTAQKMQTPSLPTQPRPLELKEFDAAFQMLRLAKFGVAPHRKKVTFARTKRVRWYHPYEPVRKNG